MNPEAVMNIGQLMMDAAIKVSGPILGAALVAGLIVSILQAVTQIHEMTLTFIPKIIASIIAMVVFFDMMLGSLIDFTVRMFSNFEAFLR